MCQIVVQQLKIHPYSGVQYEANTLLLQQMSIRTPRGKLIEGPLQSVGPTISVESSDLEILEATTWNAPSLL